MAKKPKLSKTASALVVLNNSNWTHVQFGKAIFAQVRAEHEMICKIESDAALRGLRLGIVLWRIKASLTHGEFMPFVKKLFAGRSHRTAGRYMQLARYFVEKTGAGEDTVLAIADANADLAVAASDKKSLFQKAVKFVGDKTLSELLAEAANAAAKPGSKTAKPAAPDAEQLYLLSREEIGGGLTQLENLLITENRLQYLTGHPEEIAGVVDSLRTLADKVEKAAKPFLKK